MNAKDFVQNARFQFISPEEANPAAPYPELMVGGHLPPMTPSQFFNHLPANMPVDLPPISTLFRRSYNTQTQG